MRARPSKANNENRMKTQRTLGVIALVGLMGVGSAMPAMARRGADDVVRGALVTATVTKEQAIGIAKTKLDGTVRKVQLERDHNRAVWKIRIISASQRGDFRINALTGDVLRSKIKTIRDKGTVQRVKSSTSDDHDTNDDRGRRHGGRGSDDN